MTGIGGSILARLNEYVIPPKVFTHKDEVAEYRAFVDYDGQIVAVMDHMKDEYGALMSHAERLDEPSGDYIQRFTETLIEEITTGTFDVKDEDDKRRQHKGLKPFREKNKI